MLGTQEHDSAIDAIFKALGDTTRRKIITIVLKDGAQVNDLVEQCEVPQPTISKHLKILKDAGLVSSEKDGVRRIYRMAPFSVEVKELLKWLETVKTHER